MAVHIYRLTFLTITVIIRLLTCTKDLTISHLTYMKIAYITHLIYLENLLYASLLHFAWNQCFSRESRTKHLCNLYLNELLVSAIKDINNQPSDSVSSLVVVDKAQHTEQNCLNTDNFLETKNVWNSDVDETYKKQ